MPKKPEIQKKVGSLFKGKTNEKPLWDGPYKPTGGITQSMLSTFLVCRERFRIGVIEGLGPAGDNFSHTMEYGSMWHICEEYYAKGEDWQTPLKAYCQELCKTYRMDQQTIAHWHRICVRQFPAYVKYWAKHEHTVHRKPLLEEYVFCHKYNLPNGKFIYLRGKMDSADLIKGKQVYLQENKVKGTITDWEIQKQLTFDQQTMMYLAILRRLISFGEIKVPSGASIKGVRYNIVRRPLSGGQYTIRHRKGEEANVLYDRLEEFFEEDPDWFFIRYDSEVSNHDIDRFQNEYLNPILMQVCDWWDWITSDKARGHNRFSNGIHWRTPYGFYNVLAEGGHTDIDEYLDSGSMIGLKKRKSLFPELQ